jgi:DNA-binding winged helix-turn-helix (wHTH) protein
VRFGAFELDVRAGELRKHGVRIRLQGQPFQVLLMLLERPGEVVLREEIRKKLWPNDTIVEFAPSINAAIQRLRDALTDLADQPRYVETVARRGYRFVGELIQEVTQQTTPVQADESSPDIRDLSARTISHYRVFEKLGSGAMGEVYRARDTKLGRDVALKLLPEEFADDADRMARLAREAQVLASLNHPNIAAIYGMEEPDGIRALVLELVEGPTLAERIARGAIPLEEALDIAHQIGDALQAAHEKGIVHRDLKPANVKITPEGVVKLLDFGLAGVTHGDVPKGVIAGTAAYMSPEQARGQEIDKRADIWAFGVVVYEMLTGQRPFQGDTITETLAAVTNRDPEWDRVPAPAQRLLRRCLEKDPALRLRDIGDAQLLLEDGPQITVAPRRILPWAATAAAVLIAVVFLWTAALWRSPKTADRPLVRLDVDLGSNIALLQGAGNVTLSPDGTRLVFLSSTGPKGPVRMYTRRLDQSTAKELTIVDGPGLPFFSPDGQWVGFFAGQDGIRLNKISAEGGAVVPVADLAHSNSGSWGSDGNIIVGAQDTGCLQRVPANGGAPTTALDLAPSELGCGFPQILPGGKAVLFADFGTPDGNTGLFLCRWPAEDGAAGKRFCTLFAQRTLDLCPEGNAVRGPF